MNILYYSVVSSNQLVNRVKDITGANPGYAVQKFNRHIVKGLYENGVNVRVLSSPPIDRQSFHGVLFNKTENEDGITYRYIPFINLKGLKQLCVFLYSFFTTIRQGLFHKKDSAIICDALAISACLGVVWASRLTGIRTVGILTDMPGVMVNMSNNEKGIINRLKKSFIKFINKSYLSYFSHYVFLTEQMNTALNKKNRPYLIMEGLCDEAMAKSYEVAKYDKRTIMYAGGLHERYGLKKLTEAFMSLPDSDIRLLIYGSGPYVEELRRCAVIDARIEYRGLAPNEEVVKSEQKSTLLVNPRPSIEEFTKYSFPSKNMEYMVSGTPVLTTKLPGIPKDHYPYVYFIENESVSGYADALRMALSKNDEDLDKFGGKAKRWVLKNKNTKVQTSRIITLLKQ